jgi:hypothetical protein
MGMNNWDGKDGINRIGGGIDITLSNDPARIGHIFGDRPGHIPDTPENRELLERVANNPDNYKGRDKWENDWYAADNPNGSQTWVEVRDGEIRNGGINNPPLPWNTNTGYKNSDRPF